MELIFLLLKGWELSKECNWILSKVLRAPLKWLIVRFLKPTLRMPPQKEEQDGLGNGVFLLTVRQIRLKFKTLLNIRALLDQFKTNDSSTKVHLQVIQMKNTTTTSDFTP